MSASVTDWSHYLASVCEEYAHWWEKYTLTDVTGKAQQAASKGGGLLLNLMAETMPEKDEGDPQKDKQADKIERFTVLEGLRKYAKGHVLLQGTPGSGKSTAMARLLLEEAGRAKDTTEAGEAAVEQKAPKIPVLVELRYYDQSLQQLIEDSVQRHDPSLDVGKLDQWLRQGWLLLLLDGVNELPSDAARQDVRRFRMRYEKTTSMVFTTRKLGEGGDLGIGKKLTMRPLSEAQMQDFVQAYLPGQGKAMLAQLGDRLREFGAVPLMLLMLCSVYASNQQQIPTNLGGIFRKFTQQYDNKIQQDVPDTNKSKLLWPEMLQELAFRMMVGREETEALVAIPRTEAVEIIRSFCQEVGERGSLAQAKLWLDDLLKYHLVQLGTTDSIQFRHQLIQEYYAAEKLLRQLPNLSDEVLKWNYLNYLKWTEPMTLVVGLVGTESNVLRLVQLAFEVDYDLGARLTGMCGESLQHRGVKHISDLETLPILKAYLFSQTQSNAAVSKLLGIYKKGDRFICEYVIELLGQIGGPTATTKLIDILQDDNPDTRKSAVSALGQIGNSASVSRLLNTLYDDDIHVRETAATVLSQIGHATVMSESILNSEKSRRRMRLLRILSGKRKDSPSKVVSISTLQNNDLKIRKHVEKELDQKYYAEDIETLLVALQDEEPDLRAYAAEALIHTGDTSAVLSLSNALKDSDSDVRMYAAEALGQIGDISAVPALISALQNDSETVHMWMALALGEIGDNSAVPALINALRDCNSDVCCTSAQALGWIGDDSAVPALINALQDSDSEIRSDAAGALGAIGDVAAVPALLSALRDDDDQVCRHAAEALGHIVSDSTITGLSEILNDESVDTLAVFEALKQVQGSIGHYRPLTSLSTTVRTVFISYAWNSESETIANQLDQAFQSQDINIIRDKKDTGYKANIRDFMQQIGQGKCVLVVISDKYLKSENCMFELVEIANNGDFYDRIFPIVLSDANIYKATARLKYIQHWEQQIADLETAMKAGGLANLQGITDDLNLYTKIRNNIASLTDTLKNMNTLTPEMHRDSNFEAVIDAVQDKLAE